MGDYQPTPIFDWDLWPWIVVDGYGGIMAVLTYRLERNLGRLQFTIGSRLLPVFRSMVAVAQQQSTGL